MPRYIFALLLLLAVSLGYGAEKESHEATHEASHEEEFNPGTMIIDHVIDAFPMNDSADTEKLCDKYMKPFKDGLHFGKLGHEVLKDELLKQLFQNCE